MSFIKVCPLLFYVIIAIINAIPIDNGVEGEPEIECGSTSITVTFNTRNNFEGHVYAKGFYDNQECRNDEGGRQVASITLQFDSCNVARTRSLNPRGIFVTAAVVITFHPQFLTKIDRLYRLQCFYMEADKTVSTQIEVQEITTAFFTQVVPMPICRYEILDGGPTGQPVQYAIVGQPVYHRWTCDSETVDTFCILVHSCIVDDGNGDSIELLNENGCALDKYLLNNLEYPTVAFQSDFFFFAILYLMAGQEAHVYKYADRPELFYQCQMTINIKEPNSECIRPECAEPEGFGATKRESGRRSQRKQRDISAWHDPTNTLDVRTELSTLEIMDKMDNDVFLNLKQNKNELMDISSVRVEFVPADLCFSSGAFAVIIVLFGTLSCAIFIIVIFFCRPKKSKL